MERSAILFVSMLRTPARQRLLGNEPLSPARLEAFLDGVIAIILTIMVLELKVPSTADPRGLLHAWPLFISYVISFFFVAVYWINHHHLFHRVRRVDLGILWANTALLFFLSLVPFFTEWMESTRLSAFPTAIYAATMMVCGTVFFVLDIAVGRQNLNEAELVNLRRAAHRKNTIAILIDLVAIPVAFRSPILSLGLVVLVALLYAIPGLWVERFAGHLDALQANHPEARAVAPPYTGAAPPRD